MTTIGNVYGSSINAAALNRLNSFGGATGARDADGDNNGSRGIGGTSGGGMFASALIQALSQLGVSPASGATTSIGAASGSAGATTNGSTASTQDTKSALRQFMHDLFAALQSAGNSGTATAATDSDGDNDGSKTAGTDAAGTGKQQGPWLSGVEGKLQTLIQQLSANGASTGTTGTDPVISALQNDFQNLVTASGSGGSSATLAGFLQSVSQHLQGSNPGLNVSASA